MRSQSVQLARRCFLAKCSAPSCEGVVCKRHAVLYNLHKARQCTDAFDQGQCNKAYSSDVAKELNEEKDRVEFVHHDLKV